jgi:predicted secreted Zn-dependent protease
VKKTAALAFIAAITLTTQAGAQDNWKAVEVVKPYAVAGTTGPELYDSIGQRGPKIGGRTRVIAHTSYVLTWDRTFDRTNGACTILSATPKLKITYTLPKPSQKLASPVKENWASFYEGIRKHELVHGDHARAMTREIVRRTVGLSEPNDPKCQKIRKVLIREIEGLVAVQRAQGRDFDRVEMGRDGNVERLILALVNGG